MTDDTTARSVRIELSEYARLLDQLSLAGDQALRLMDPMTVDLARAVGQLVAELRTAVEREDVDPATATQVNRALAGTRTAAVPQTTDPDQWAAQRDRMATHHVHMAEMLDWEAMDQAIDECCRVLSADPRLRGQDVVLKMHMEGDGLTTRTQACLDAVYLTTGPASNRRVVLDGELAAAATFALSSRFMYTMDASTDEYGEPRTFERLASVPEPVTAEQIAVLDGKMAMVRDQLATIEAMSRKLAEMDDEQLASALDAGWLHGIEQDLVDIASHHTPHRAGDIQTHDQEEER